MRILWLLLAFSALACPQSQEYNPIYRDPGGIFSRQPNAFLVETVRQRKPGRALDVGMGQGRNSIFLAQQGWDVTGFDPADEGVRQARAEAARLGVRVSAEVNTFENFAFGESRWDLIVITYEPTKAIAPKVVRALKLGGAVVVEDRHLDTKRVWPAGTFEDNELITLFPGLRVLRYEDVWARPDWSARGVDERLVRLVAEKPQPKPDGCLWNGKPVAAGDSTCWETSLLRCRTDGWQFTRERCSR